MPLNKETKPNQTKFDMHMYWSEKENSPENLDWHILLDVSLECKWIFQNKMALKKG